MKLIRSIFEPIRPRLKPSFIIVGAQKAGTSALFKALSEHPKVIPPDTKELDFFSKDDRFDQGVNHYLQQFPVKPWKYQNEITFEASPSYLESQVAPMRINDTLPGVRVIMVLRDPVKRAFSAWNMFRQFKDHPIYSYLYDPRSFEVAIEDELKNRVEYSRKYLSRGLYVENVKRYLETFIKDRVLILSYPQYRKEPSTVLNKICEFIDIEKFEEQSTAGSRTANVRPYEHSIDPTMKEVLYRHYAPYMRDLRGLIGNTADICEDDAYRHLWT